MEEGSGDSLGNGGGEEGGRVGDGGRGGGWYVPVDGGR
jgi:hypothetical protein